MEQRFEELADRFDALSLDANINRNDERQRTGDDVPHGQPRGRPNFANRRRQQVYEEDSNEEGEYFADAGRHAGYRVIKIGKTCRNLNSPETRQNDRFWPRKHPTV